MQQAFQPWKRYEYFPVFLLAGTSLLKNPVEIMKIQAAKFFSLFVDLLRKKTVLDVTSDDRLVAVTICIFFAAKQLATKLHLLVRVGC